MKYRKKAVVIEASLWRKPGDHPAVVHPLPSHLKAPHDREQFGAIETLEGWMLVTPGDYVIRGVNGEFYACKPDIFAKTYEPVDDDGA